MPDPRFAPADPLTDRQGRRISYLRFSVTDRCGFRCSYCSPETHSDARDFLRGEEIARLIRLFARLGIRRIRLTGGEPTLRSDLVEIAGAAHGTPGIEEVALTTNGQRLGELAAPLRRAGVGAVNVSLDTLDAGKLSRISGRGADLTRVLAGIDAAAATGFAALKINTVVIRGVNEGEAADLVRFAWSRGAVPRFIELMPFGAGEPVPTIELKDLLRGQGLALEPDATRGWGPAHHVLGWDPSTGATGLIGFIGALTENFCERCNRCRVTARGEFQSCLGGQDREPLGALLRAGASDDELTAAVRRALGRKDDRHHMDQEGARLVLLPMMGIGG
jgi:GTP 3',8-cyclase